MPASAPVSGPASTKRASGWRARTCGIAETKSSGRLRSWIRARKSTVGGRPGSRAGLRFCGRTPLTSRTVRVSGTGAATSFTSTRSISVRCRTASASRSTLRTPSRSVSWATFFSVGSIMPWVWTTSGVRDASARSAAGRVTRSRIRWTCTRSAPRIMRRAVRSRVAEVMPLTSNIGSRCRAWKRWTGTPSTRLGSSPSGNPSPRAMTRASSPAARWTLDRLNATRVGPPKAWSGVWSVTTCRIFTRVPLNLGRPFTA